MTVRVVVLPPNGVTISQVGLFGGLYNVCNTGTGDAYISGMCTGRILDIAHVDLTGPAPNGGLTVALNGARPNVLTLLRLLAETEVSAAAQKQIAYSYLWFGDLPAAQVQAGTNATRWYVTDHLGTPFLVTDSSGAPVWRAEYAPYGTVFTTRAGTSLHQPLRFPGQVAMDGAESYYNVFRHYRSGWGRYTQPDPARHVTAHAPYQYAGSSPAVRIDPLGLLSTVPGPPPPNMGTVYCDGAGGVAIQLDPRFSNQQLSCYAATCLVIHEQQHAMDFAMTSANRICQGQPRGTWIIYNGRREEDFYELRADVAELQCLASQRCTASGPCKSLIDQRVQQLNADQVARRGRGVI